jgi:hypothetical protein
MLPNITLWWKRGTGTPVEQSLAAWGLERPEFTHGTQGGASQSDDIFTAMTTALVDSTPAFAYGDRVELFQGDTRIFVGWARSPKKLGKMPEGLAFAFEGPSRFLRSDYRMTGNVLDVGTGTYSTLLTSEIVLGLQNGLDAGDPTVNRLTVLQQVTAILEFGQANGDGGSAAPFDIDTTGVPAVTLPEIGKTTSSMLSCLDALFALLPSIRAWWDYTTVLGGGAATRGDRPVLRFVNTETINVTTGAAISPPTLTGGASPTTHTIANDGTTLKEFTPVPQDARLIKTLAVLFGEESDVVDFGDGRQGRPIIYTTFTSTVANGSPIERVVTMMGRSAVWNGTAYANPETAPTANLARLLHQGFDRIWYDVSATTGEQSALHLEWRPCDLLCISGAGSDLAGAYAMIQSITRDLYTGEESIESGAPSKRGVGQLVAARLPVARGGGGGGGPVGDKNNQGMAKPKPKDDGTGVEGPAGASPDITAGTLTTHTDFVIEMPLTPPSLINKTLNIKVKPITLAFGTLGYTGGTPGGTVTGTWGDGFTLDLLLPYTVFGDVVTGDPGTEASVSGQGTSGDPLIFTIPRGDTGTVEMGYLEELHTIGGSDFDGTQDVTSFPVPGPIGGTTPDTAAFTKVTINSTGSDKCIQASSDSGTCVEASSYSGCALSGASTTGDLLDLSGGSGFGGQVLNVNNAGLLRHNGALALKPQTLAPALNAGAACSVINAATNFAINGTNALTLGNPSGGSEDGQVKVIVCTAVTAAGTATLTPTSCTGFSTVAFTAAGQTLTLQYFTTGGWVILSVRGATPA